jgi:GNAT superfamily N-acetyltransferase
MSLPVIRRLKSIGPRELAGLSDVLIDCVEGGASVSFMLPMTRAKAEAFWTSVAASLERGERAVVIAEDPRGEIMGTVQAIWATQENQPHRADVAKMLVSRAVRRQGIARRLMAAIDTIAREEGKTVLVLDTVTGSPASRLYEQAGWQRVGDVPKYALMPDGEFCSTTYFYKHL